MNIDNFPQPKQAMLKLNQYAVFLLLAINSTFAFSLGNTATNDIVAISEAWVRPTNPGQEVGAAYMTLTSKQNLDLVSAISDASGSVEIHSMTMENGIMKMRNLDSLALEAGKPYRLAPGGFHLMLFDLKKPLNIGEYVNFVLTFKNKNNEQFKQNIKANIQAPKESASHKH